MRKNDNEIPVSLQIKLAGVAFAVAVLGVTGMAVVSYHERAICEKKLSEIKTAQPASAPPSLRRQ